MVCALLLRHPFVHARRELQDETLQGLLGRLTWHDDQSKYNDRKAFDLVAGLFLSEVPGPGDGPLWVRPRSHRTGHAPGCAGAPCSCGCVGAGATHSDLGSSTPFSLACLLGTCETSPLKRSPGYVPWLGRTQMLKRRS